MAELMVKEEELVQKEELVKCLQEELVQVRLGHNYVDVVNSSHEESCYGKGGHVLKN